VNTAASLLLLAMALVCLGIPVTATVVVYREELAALWARVRRALSFDPRHPALDHHLGR
jgi:hypothetical protein